MYGFDLSNYQGDGLGVRRALQKHLRKNGKTMGYDFADLNDDQLTDDYHYMIFPNITMNIHCNSMMLFRQRPHETDPNKMYFDLQNYAMIPKGTGRARASRASDSSSTAKIRSAKCSIRTRRISRTFSAA